MHTVACLFFPSATVLKVPQCEGFWIIFFPFLPCLAWALAVRSRWLSTKRKREWLGQKRLRAYIESLWGRSKCPSEEEETCMAGRSTNRFPSVLYESSWSNFFVSSWQPKKRTIPRKFWSILASAFYWQVFYGKNLLMFSKHFKINDYNIKNKDVFYFGNTCVKLA